MDLQTDNFKIAVNRESGSTVRLCDRVVDGVTYPFEVRFGPNAVSEKNCVPSSTGMAEVNLMNQQIRVVMDSVREVLRAPQVAKLKDGVKLYSLRTRRSVRFMLEIDASVRPQCLTLSFSGTTSSKFDFANAIDDKLTELPDPNGWDRAYRWDHLSAGKSKLVVVHLADDCKLNHETVVEDALAPPLRAEVQAKYTQCLEMVARDGDEGIDAHLDWLHSEIMPLVEQLMELSNGKTEECVTKVTVLLGELAKKQQARSATQIPEAVPKQPVGTIVARTVVPPRRPAPSPPPPPPPPPLPRPNLPPGDGPPVPQHLPSHVGARSLRPTPAPRPDDTARASSADTGTQHIITCQKPFIHCQVCKAAFGPPKFPVSPQVYTQRHWYTQLSPYR